MNEVLRAAGGAAAVMYALGFLRFRTRLNLLGVWTELPVLDQRYLSEAALLLVNSLETVFASPLGAMGLLAGGLLVVRLRSARSVAIVERALDSTGWVAILLVLLSAYAWFTAWLSLRRLSTIALLLDTSRPVLENHPGEYVLLLALAVVTGAMCWTLAPLAKERAALTARVALTFLGGLLTLQVVLLPMNHAAMFLDQPYPVATVETNERERHCIFLLSQSGGALVGYDGRAVVTFPESKIAYARIHQHVSIQAAPKCPAQPGPAAAPAAVAPGVAPAAAGQ